MICEWGMSDKLGPVTLGKADDLIFLAREISRHNDYSEATALEIDTEIKRIVSENYDKAINLLKQNVNILHKLAELLLQKEVIDSKELDSLVKGFKASINLFGSTATS